MFVSCPSVRAHVDAWLEAVLISLLLTSSLDLETTSVVVTFKYFAVYKNAYLLSYSDLPYLLPFAFLGIYTTVTLTVMNSPVTQLTEMS